MRSLNSVGSVLARSIIGLVSLAVVVAAFGASAAPIFVGFESDPEFLESDPAVPVLNRFTSLDSPLVDFSDTSSADGDGLTILDAFGSRGIAVLDDDDSGLLMEFDFVASALSLDFGNASLADFDDEAVLTLLLDGGFVASTSVVLNDTNQIDQTISYSGLLFNSAILNYDVADGLTEFADNIQVTPAIPEPSAGFVFGMGALLVGAVCGRRSPTEVELRAAHH
jgi:hypothetical protein